MRKPLRSTFIFQDGGYEYARVVNPRIADTMLHVAARHRQPAIALMLIAAGADVNAMDELHHPPLVDALDTRFMPTVGATAIGRASIRRRYKSNRPPLWSGYWYRRVRISVV